MRALVVSTVLSLAFFAVAARADDAPALGCADFQSNKTGGDPACDAAIASATDPKAKSTMLFRRAYMEDAAGDFSTYPKALADLDEAIRLWPQNVSALHERGYLYNEYGRWKDAEKDLDAQIALRPADPHGYQERGMSRYRQGNLQGAFEDDDAEVALEPGEASNYVRRAQTAMWLGRFDAAKSDLDKAESLAAQSRLKDTGERITDGRALLAAWTKTSGAASAVDSCRDADKKNDYGREGLIGDCTRAFLDAKTPKDRGDALTVRASAWLLGRHDEGRSLDDFAMAAALSPNAMTLSNLGFAYLNSRHSAGALVQFDQAIAAGGSGVDFFVYAGRAEARYNTGDDKGAIEDAKRSLAIKANDLALEVEGDAVYRQTKSYDQAKPYWIAAYKLGHPSDELIQRLKDAGVPIPPP